MFLKTLIMENFKHVYIEAKRIVRQTLIYRLPTLHFVSSGMNLLRLLMHVTLWTMETFLLE